MFMASDSTDVDFNPRSPHGERPFLTALSVSPSFDFNPRSPHGERRYVFSRLFICMGFQSTLPARGATKFRKQYFQRLNISIHAPRTGSDQAAVVALTGNGDFNPRSPHGERRWNIGRRNNVRDISIHAPRTGSDVKVAFPPLTIKISIHAPRTGSDAQFCSTTRDRSISIHAPRTGSDRPPRPALAIPTKFQSTLPARGATAFPCPASRAYSNFNPRSPHGERPGRCNSFHYTSHFNPRSPHGERHTIHVGDAVLAISIHAPRTGSDTKNTRILQERRISIHAPRTGSDGDAGRAPLRGRAISIHAPRTGSDGHDCRAAVPRRISIHAPRTGSDDLCAKYRFSGADFNPRSPHGERLRKVTILSIRIIGFAQKVYHKTVLLRISLAENAVILPEKPRNPVRTSLQKAGGLRFARAIRAARPYSISSPSGA